MKQKIIEIKHLKLWREQAILQDLNWIFHAEEHWVILGPNGSGKSTLLGALTGYVTPSSGKLIVLDQTYGQSDWRELRKKVGLVSTVIHSMIQADETAFKLVLSGKEATINHWGKIPEKDLKEAKSILKKIKASHLQERTWIQLSQGERQRVLIGRALMADYKILILDEPCAGLDLVAREKFLRFLAELASSRKAPALIFVTHHVEEIIPIFQNVLLLKNGKVLASGKKEKILTSALLSETFGCKILLQKQLNRYQVKISKKAKK